MNRDRPTELWGVEASLEQQLTFLPGALSGLGVYLNYTYTRGKQQATQGWFAPVFDENGNLVGREYEEVVFNGVPYTGQAPHSGTAALTYNKYGFDASLAYTFQSRRQLSYSGNGLSQYNDADRSLDLKVEYRFGKTQTYRVFVEGADLLKGPHDPELLVQAGGDRGAPRFTLNGTYLGGRQLRAGFAVTF